MTLIKNNRIQTDTWRYRSADEELAKSRNIVSLEYWLEHKSRLVTNNQELGLLVSGDTHIDDFSDALEHISLIAINIPVFTDGRGYSLAKRLRQQYNFKHEIRAVGDVLPDQALYLTRVGFDSMELANEKKAELALSKLSDYSVFYQTA
ncbi:MAG: oxidoreductase [Piscirickettsiaceae bacterium]|nr:MAG: oxidoreductase [Piscirickettsiaceae bacterium]